MTRDFRIGLLRDRVSYLAISRYRLSHVWLDGFYVNY